MIFGLINLDVCKQVALDRDIIDNNLLDSSFSRLYYKAKNYYLKFSHLTDIKIPDKVFLPTFNLEEEFQVTQEDVVNTLRKELKEKCKELELAKNTLVKRKLFSDDVYEAINKANINYSFNFVNVPKVIFSEGNHLILPISDVHYGEVVKANQVNNFNEYNCEIAKKRIVKLFNEALIYAKQNKCSDLNIIFLGDIFSGNIHDELLTTNDYGISVCVMEFYGFISSLIESIKDEFESIKLNAVVGNHPRFQKKFQYKNKAIDSFEYFLYHGLYFKFNNKENFIVNISNSPIDYVDIGCSTWKIQHGDFYKGGSSPSGPINNILKNSAQDLDMLETLSAKSYDYELMGHFHQPSINHMKGTNIPIIVNSSIIGPNEFAINSLHTAFPSSSYLIVTDGISYQTKLFYLQD